MRNRIKNATKIASSNSVFIGCNGFTNVFNPGDWLYDQYQNKDEILVYEELERDEARVELSMHMLEILDEITTLYPNANKIKVGNIYSDISMRIRDVFNKAYNKFVKVSYALKIIENTVQKESPALGAGLIT